jgi:heme exporter protein B
MWRTARLVAAKDLRVEWRSKVVTNQVLPFAGLTLILFAFALDRDDITTLVAPGLFWLATTFSLIVLVQRTFAVESADGALDSLRVAGVDPAGIYLGKSLALAVQLLVLEALLMAGVIVFYAASVRPEGIILVVITALAATCGLAFVGTLYGGLAAGAKGRETLLPLLLLPVVAPVLIGATRAFEAAFGTREGDGLRKGVEVVDGWPWVGLLAVFAAVFGAAGVLAFGPLLEEA